MTQNTIDSLSSFNNASQEAAHAWLMQTCTSEKWCTNMLNKRPFYSIDMLCQHAQNEWQTMENADYMQAFSGHPMIGDLSSLRAKYAATKALAQDEQSSTSSADEVTLLALQDKNQAYLAKHGFIFIICATGLSAQTMLDELEKRLPNSTSTEIENAAREQIKITLLRINKAFTH